MKQIKLKRNLTMFNVETKTEMALLTNKHSSVSILSCLCQEEQQLMFRATFNISQLSPVNNNQQHVANRIHTHTHRERKKWHCVQSRWFWFLGVSSTTTASFIKQSSQLIIESKQHNFYRKIFATNGSVFALTAREKKSNYNTSKKCIV